MAHKFLRCDSFGPASSQASLDLLPISTDASNIAPAIVPTSQVYGHAKKRNESEKLPVELLIKIFGYASGVYGEYYTFEGYYISKLHDMAQVCRRWLKIIKGAAELWTCVTDQVPSHTFLPLKRSESHTFSLFLTRMPLERSLYNVVLNHSHRWRQAHIRFSPGDEDALRGLEEVRVPLLRHLHLESLSWGESSIFILDLFRAHPPKLMSLALTDIMMYCWNSPVFGSHLRSFKLDPIDRFGPTREDLYYILIACPELAYLELVHITLSDGIGVFGQTPRVKLSLLHTLILTTLSPVDTIDVIGMVETPHCRSYSVSKDLRNLDPAVLSVVARHVQKPFEACIASGISLDIYHNDYWIHLTSHDGYSNSYDFSLSFSIVGSCKQVLDWLNAALLFRSLPLLPIPVDLDLDYSFNKDPLPSPSDFLRLSSVRSLTIRDHRGYTTCLVEALSALRSLEDGGVGWLWPNLREVTVRSFRNSQTLLHMVKMRTEAALPRQGTAELGEIAMLERSKVGSGVFKVGEFEAVRAVLGDVVAMSPRRSYLALL
ncbi:hypothetical protein FRB94_003390 [Tulasnella sp. JGI-2019a]|nr:hypothetical protein FRB93_004133 [Tulasnella sp. JGI-2019a]KAG9003077.1 hypothetical protein FRB94_003390 [Tulasnella sp. JGI-2019a]